MLPAVPFSCPRWRGVCGAGGSPFRPRPETQMAKAKHYVPSGLRSITTHLVVPNALQAIEFYQTVFGAELESHAPGPTPGSTIHAALRIGDAALFLADEMPQSKAKSP